MLKVLQVLVHMSSGRVKGGGGVDEAIKRVVLGEGGERQNTELALSAEQELLNI